MIDTVLMVGGWDYVSISAEEEDYIATVQSVVPDVLVIKVDSNPQKAKALGVNVVPSLVRTHKGEVLSTLVGVCSKEQIESFIGTGVSPI